METLVEQMKQLCAANAPGLVTTAQVERSVAFTRYVYGGSRPQPPPDCGQ